MDCLESPYQQEKVKVSIDIEIPCIFNTNELFFNTCYMNKEERQLLKTTMQSENDMFFIGMKEA